MKSTVFSLVFTIFLFWLTIQIETSLEEYLAYFLVLTIGIAHGSNDIALIKNLSRTKSSWKKYLTLYIVVILIKVIAFSFFPALALFLFVVVSCYHFGEQHFSNAIIKLNPLAQLLFLSYGFLIFGLLFYFNHEQTTTIIAELVGYTFKANVFLWFLIIGIVTTVLCYAFNFKNFSIRVDHFQQLFLIFVFAILFYKASLLWAFSIYFVIWHSVPSLKDQIALLYGKLNRKSLILYIKSSFINWLLSIFGLGIIYIFTFYFDINFVVFFFIFLATITLPHVIVMYVLNRDKNKMND